MNAHEIEPIPRESEDLGTHVSLCAQRHRQTIREMRALREDLDALRRDLRRIGLVIVGATGVIANAPYIAQAWPLIQRFLGG